MCTLVYPPCTCMRTLVHAPCTRPCIHASPHMMIKFNISWNNGEPGQGGGGNLGPCEMTRMIMIMVPPLIITPCYAQRIAARPMVAMQHWAGHSLLRGGRGDVPSARALRRSYFKTKGAVCVGHACSHGLGVPGCPREDPPPLGSSRLALILIVLMSAKYQGVTWTTVLHTLPPHSFP